MAQRHGWYRTSTRYTKNAEEIGHRDPVANFKPRKEPPLVYYDELSTMDHRIIDRLIENGNLEYQQPRYPKIPPLSCFGLLVTWSLIAYLAYHVLIWIL